MNNSHERNTLQDPDHLNGHLPEFIGKSIAIQELYQSIKKVAQNASRVLILGESGSGKELAARWIHHLSSRSEQPFVAVNCAAIPSELIESELFGHEKGAFTGAIQRKTGRFEDAEEGTLFLDELGDLSLSAQAKLLRALQENQFYRVGGNKPIRFHARVLAATNRDLMDAVSKGKFRHDLYYRLAILILHVPSLRERREDIPLLVRNYLEHLIEQERIGSCVFTKGAMDFLKRLEWPGNIRQLHNVVERVALLANGPEITKEDILHFTEEDEHSLLMDRNSAEREDSIRDFLLKSGTFRQFKERSEAWYLEHKLTQCGGNVAKTAEELGITRSALYEKIKKYSLQEQA